MGILDLALEVDINIQYAATVLHFNFFELVEKENFSRFVNI